LSVSPAQRLILDNLVLFEGEKPPKVDLSSLPKYVRCKAGKPLEIQIPYEAFPIPSVAWRKNGQPINVKHGLQSNANKVAGFKMEKASRADKGKYECVMSNSRGEIVVEMEVDIVDKPASPKGPLKVSDVTNQSALLSWQPPEDDGGAPITQYIIEKLDTSRGDWSLVSSRVSQSEFGNQVNFKVSIKFLGRSRVRRTDSAQGSEIDAAQGVPVPR
jgi:titin